MQKNSFIDYPGKISCVIFLAGCNFTCPYCHNPELARGSSSACVNEDDVYDFLEKRKGFLDGVVVSGGEPTLCKDLFSICERIKQMGYSLKLDTNGSRPEVIRRLIDENLVDYIAMDIKTDPLNYDPVIQNPFDPERILSSIQVIMQSNIPYEFRTTCVKPLVDEAVVARISRLVENSMLYALQQFHNNGVLKPEFFSDERVVYDESEMMHLKSVAEPWVQKCIIR